MKPGLSEVEVGFLGRGPWFGGLPAALQALILAHSRQRSYRRGEFLIREGEPGKGMHALLQGRTRHVRSVGDGGEVLIFPARAGASRFPGKPLALLRGRPLIQHVWERATACPALRSATVGSMRYDFASTQYSTTSKAKPLIHVV